MVLPAAPLARVADRWLCTENKNEEGPPGRPRPMAKAAG